MAKRRRIGPRSPKTGLLICRIPNRGTIRFYNRILGRRRDDCRAELRGEEGHFEWWQEVSDRYYYWDWGDDDEEPVPCECCDARLCRCDEPNALIALAKLHINAPLSWSFAELGLARALRQHFQVAHSREADEVPVAVNELVSSRVELFAPLCGHS